MRPRSTIRRPRICAGVLAAVATLACALPAVGKGPAITIKSAGASPVVGIQDDRLIVDPDPAARVRMIVAAGAAVIRVDMRWDLVAPTKPTNPTNPADPAYAWARYDAIVAAARANDVRVLFTVYGTPAWAQDPTVSLEPRWENWTVRPQNAADYGAFAEAAATRYAPLGVNDWEVWNESNISLFLRPQYERRAGQWVPASPATYSGLLKAFYAAVKRVDRDAVIGGGVMAPAGDRCPDCAIDAPPVRVPPDDFIRALDDPALRPPMDVVSHHPYPITPPRTFTPPDRTYVDLYNLGVLVRQIDGTYLRGKRLWLTEYGFSTAPVFEYRNYFNPTQQANHIADAYRRIKANPRVDLLTYYLLQDHANWRSGLLTQAGTPKPGYQAHALPLATTSGLTTVRRGAAVSLVGQVRNATAATTVRIQWKSGTRWITMRSVRTTRDGSFRISLRPAVTTTLRAQWTGVTRSRVTAKRTSLPVTLRVS